MKHERIYFDKTDERVFLDIYAVTDPLMSKREAMLVIPGGGYSHVCADREGECIALAFAAKGMNAFVLTYSVGQDAVYPRQLLDAARAMAYIKEHAEEYHIDPDRIYGVGFSAGGHLLGTLTTLHGEAEELLGRARSGEENLERNILLEARGDLIERTFERAKREILEMPEPEYLDFITSLLAATFVSQLSDEAHNRELYGEDGDEVVERYEVILNTRDKERLGERVITGAREKLASSDAKAYLDKLVLADDTSDSIDGGLVLRCGSMEINNSVKAIFGELRPRVEGEVSRILFPNTDDRKKG